MFKKILTATSAALGLTFLTISAIALIKSIFAANDQNLLKGLEENFDLFSEHTGIILVFYILVWIVLLIIFDSKKN